MAEINYPPTGELIDIGGYRLHLHRMGSGSPAVIMDSGLGALSLLYELVLPRIAEFTTAVSYDRAGYAWSDPAPAGVSRTSRQRMTELHTLLEKAVIPPPYLLVGNSFGAINVMVYADLYPDEVAGLVMIDPSTPRMVDIPGVPSAKTMEQSARVMRVLARLGVVKWFAGALYKPVIPGWKNLPPAIWDMNLALSVQPAFYDTWVREAADGAASFAQAQQAEQSLKDKPLIVLTGGEMWTKPGSQLGRPEAMKKGMLAQRKAMAALSSKGQHRIIEGASHTMQVDHPDAVVQAVREVVEAARATTA
jgi:pimeloyl-ACP methyl ester carboxylesterase